MVENKVIKKEEFLELSEKYDLIWIGEIHGIVENYKAYKEIISDLVNKGFKNLLWEMDADFSSESDISEDGRVNSFAILFLDWINKKIKKGELENLTFFGEVRNYGKKFLNNEEEMAEQIIKNINNKKTIIITGNFHMGGPLNIGMKIEPCLTFVKNKTNLKILKIGIKYAGGSLYNFGLKKISPDFYFGDKDNIKFGTITRNVDNIFFHVGKAHAVYKIPIIKK